MQIEAVIGANYGDEGKGLFTEYLCRNRPSPLVILSNGGCQRGHTVNNIEQGIRHVFHHFGSGTLVGTPSVYSKTFLLNPIKYIEEKRELEQHGIKPIAFRAPGCLLQLPGDMLINQILEHSRSRKKHGSCGWGIWETQVRNTQHASLTFEDFAAMDYDAKRSRMLDEFQWQLSNRLYDVHDMFLDHAAIDAISSDGFCKHFIDDFIEMEKDVKVLSTNDIAENDFSAYGLDVQTLVVECGQGLLLDKKYAPEDENGRTDVHTTPSQCGVDGVTAALGNGGWSYKSLTANYISRTYFTRHGAGPFPEETVGLKFNDETNIYNQYQDSIRFGYMTEDSYAKMQSRIAYDSSSGHPAVKQANTVMTHCNEVEPYGSLKTIAKFFSYSDTSSQVRETLLS